MRKRTLGVVVLVGLAISGRGAFTSGSAMTGEPLGHGEGTVSGVTVTDTNYTISAADPSKITGMSFTHAEALTSNRVLLRLTNGGDVVTSSTCVPGAGGAAAQTVCSFGGVAVADFDGFGLTVTH